MAFDFEADKHGANAATVRRARAVRAEPLLLLPMLHAGPFCLLLLHAGPCHSPFVPLPLLHHE